MRRSRPTAGVDLDPGHADPGGIVQHLIERLCRPGVHARRQGGIVEAQGRNGDANARLDREIVRLTAMSDMVENHMSQMAEADYAELSMRLSATQSQYQAVAKVFSDIRNLTLVNYLD